MADYTSLVLAEKNPSKRATMIDQILKSGNTYDTKTVSIADKANASANPITTTPRTNTAPLAGPTTPNRVDILNASDTIGGNIQPSYATSYQPTQAPSGNIIKYKDQAGNIQELNESYEKSGQLPKGWVRYNEQTTTTPTVTDIAESLRKANLESAKSGLGATRENVLAKLSTQKSQIEPRITEQRSSAVSGTAIAQKRLADLIPFSGTMAGTQLNKAEQINTGLQQRQSELDKIKEQEYADIASQETEAERVYQQGLAQSDAEAMQTYQQRLLQQQQQADERAYQDKQTAEQRTYNEQQLADERAYTEQKNKEQQTREDYLVNIGQFDKNFQAEINNLKAQGIPDDDYRVMALKTARTEKIANLDAAKQNAYLKSIADEEEKQEQALELAKWRFNLGMPATQADSQLLGIAVGQVSPAQVIKQAELALAKQKEARVASGKSSGGSSSGSGAKNTDGTPTKPIVTTATLRSQIDKNVATEIASRGLLDNATTMNQLRADQIIRYSENGQLTDKQASELIATYGLTQSEVEQAERRLQLMGSLGGK